MGAVLYPFLQLSAPPMSRNPQTCWLTRLHLLGGVVALAALSACGEGPVSPPAGLSDVGAESALFARAPQVDVCHRTGSGSYVLLTINAHAVPAHEAHGDAAPGDAVPGGSGAIFGTDCVPQAEDVTGTYELQTVGGQPLPALGTGEMLHAGTIVLEEDGSCSVSATSNGDQDDPDGELITFTFQSCEYSLEGTHLTLAVFDEEEGSATLTGQLSDGQIILQILIWDDGDETDEGTMGDAVFVKV